MIQVFPIEFIRELIRQTLLREKIKDIHLVGGDDEINIFSFYEQVASQDDVDRYVENYRELTKQQNRSSLIGNGVIVCPSAPSITNLYSSTIIPMDWSLMVRSTLANRDSLVATFNNLIETLNGRAHDFALLKCNDENGKDYYVPFVLPRLGNDKGTSLEQASAPRIKSGMYIGDFTTQTMTSTVIETKITNLVNSGYVNAIGHLDYLYYISNGVIKVAVHTGSATGSQYTLAVEDDGTHPQVIFPPQHESCTFYKVSMSFEALRGDTPRSLNSEEVWDLNLSGSATLVNKNVKLGNDLIRLAITTYGVKGNQDTIYSTPTKYWLEPLEIGSSMDTNSDPYQLLSKFKPTTHTDSITPTIQYSFVVNEYGFSYALWQYSRYGIGFFNQGNLIKNNPSPNTLYLVDEYYMSFGVSYHQQYYAKIINAIEVNNTESDTLTVSVTFQVQDNNLSS